MSRMPSRGSNHALTCARSVRASLFGQRVLFSLVAPLHLLFHYPHFRVFDAFLSPNYGRSVVSPRPKVLDAPKQRPNPDQYQFTKRVHSEP